MTVYDSLAHFGTVSMTTKTLGVNDPELGTRRIVGDEEYIFVYNAGNTPVLVGDAVTISATTGYSVTVTMATGVGCVMGVCKHNSLTTDAYGWLLTRGFTQINMHADNSVAVNGLLVNGTDGKFAPKSISTDNPARTIGAAMAAIASGASGTAFISVW